jgi:hypothetical protein
LEQKMTEVVSGKGEGRHFFNFYFPDIPYKFRLQQRFSGSLITNLALVFQYKYVRRFYQVIANMYHEKLSCTGYVKEGWHDKMRILE